MTNKQRKTAIEWLQDEIRSLRLAPKINGCGPENWADLLEIMETCLEAVRGHGNEPLTLEQLREMDGKPAYWPEDDSWGIISVDSYGLWAGKPFFRGRKQEVNFEYNIESRGMEVYAYPPAHIDREAWTGCECNNGKKNCCTCVSMQCHFCVNGSEYNQGSYCSACGRPLTPEAWEELEKRLRG